MLKKKLIRSAIFIIPLILIFSQCFKSKYKDQRGNAYAGSASCMNCHKSISSSYLHTAHFMASQPASVYTIQGPFATGANELVFNPHLKVVMNKRDSGFYQTSFNDNRKEQTQRFDICFGGVKGQTYAYWFANELFQLPISYDDVSHQWINSPGYQQDKAAFERVIGIKCMDCHASNIKKEAPDLPGYYSVSEGFDKASLVFGIDCERCHGPAAQHVRFQTNNPDEKIAHFITSYKSLNRSQKISMCAVCHSGGSNHMLKPSFHYKPGDASNKYMKLDLSNAPVNYKIIDVHGNQTGLLSSSKCFLNSNMECSTCHNTHVNERNSLNLFAARCISCHNNNSHNLCKLTGKLSGAILTNNCISCHMPALPSKLIIAGKTGALVYTHHIAIYPEETKKVLSLLQIEKRVL